MIKGRPTCGRGRPRSQWASVALVLLASLVSAATLDFERDMPGLVPTEGKQPLVLTRDRAHGGAQSAYSGPPGSTRCMSYKLPKPIIGRVEAWFYDDMAPAKRQTVCVANDAQGEYLLFVCGTPTVYQARVGMTYTDTAVKRSLGWHRITFTLDGRRAVLAIDGAEAFVADKLGRIDSLMLGSPWDDSTGWYDDLSIEARELSPAEQAALDAAEAKLRAEALRARLAGLAADRGKLTGELRAATYGHLGATTPMAGEFYRRLNRYVRYHQPGMRDFPGQPGWRYHKIDHSQEHAVRQNATTALCYATLAVEPSRYSAELGGVPLATVISEAKGLLRYLAYTHVANGWPTGDGKSWGNHWQSALWTRYAGHAAWLLWDQLDDDLKTAVARMVVQEADRFLTRAPDSGVKLETKAEENAWN